MKLKQAILTALASNKQGLTKTELVDLTKAAKRSVERCLVFLKKNGLVDYETKRAAKGRLSEALVATITKTGKQVKAEVATGRSFKSSVDTCGEC